MYSLLFNPCEERFALLRYNVFEKMSEAKALVFSKSAEKETQLVVEEVNKITKDEINAFFMHTNEFLRIGR